MRERRDRGRAGAMAVCLPITRNTVSTPSARRAPWGEMLAFHTEERRGCDVGLMLSTSTQMILRRTQRRVLGQCLMDRSGYYALARQENA